MSHSSGMGESPMPFRWSNSSNTPAADNFPPSSSSKLSGNRATVGCKQPSRSPPPTRRAKMLPEPTLTFTIPSLHDGTVLKCRVYHPWSLSPSPKAPPWRHDAAIVAHPYAPLGGSYDDGIVSLVATTLLRAGFLVATFNFRGAVGSAGRTSWTARAERGDYLSVAGFLALYAHILDPFRHAASQPATPIKSGFTTPTRLPRSPSASYPRPHAATRSRSDDDNFPPLSADPAATPLLVFSGYSYGALVTSQLPQLSGVLAPLLAPEHGTPAAEIRLRAEHLAATQNEILGAARRAAEREAVAAARGTPSTSPRKSLNLRVGGDEEIGHHHHSRRKSHDSHRSLRRSIDDAEEKLLRGVHDLLAKTRHGSPPPRRSASLHGVAGQRQLKLRSVSSPDPGRYGDASPVIREAADEDEPEGAGEDVVHKLPTLLHPPSPTPAYLLVSPPLSIAGNLTSLSFSLPSLPKRLLRRASVPPANGPGGDANGQDPLLKGPQRAATEALGVAADSTSPVGGNLALDSLAETDRKMVENSTLVVYGDSDVFVSNRRMRGWAARLQAVPGSKFRAHEVSTAGHFWQEGPADGESVAHVLRHAVQTFADGLLQKRTQR
ncbi:hypothetical protein RB596_006621 [Gaeumannomyces avenae]